MKPTLSFLRSNWGIALWIIGPILFVVGDTKEANDAEGDDTFSEGYKKLPPWVKQLVFFVIGFVCCHLAEWRIGSDVTVKGDLNINVEEDKKP